MAIDQDYDHLLYIFLPHYDFIGWYQLIPAYPIKFLSNPRVKSLEELESLDYLVYKLIIHIIDHLSPVVVSFLPF